MQFRIECGPEATKQVLCSDGAWRQTDDMLSDDPNAVAYPMLFESWANACEEAKRISGATGLSTVKAVPNVSADDTSWRIRELIRFQCESYKALPWAHEAWWINAYPMWKDHYPHIAGGDPTRIAFTYSKAHGIEDRQTLINPAKYLVKYFGLSNEQAARCAGIMGCAVSKLMFADTPDDIEFVYRHGPSSCMAYDVSRYASSVHPSRIYGAGELAIAYITDPDNAERITARTLCWPANNIYTRVYGDESRLVPLLEAKGFEYNDGEDMEGAKLLRIEERGAYVMPYVDWIEKATVFADHIELGDVPGRPDDKAFEVIDTQGVDGYCLTDCCTCDGCGDRINEDNTYSMADGDSRWCTSCVEQYGFCCVSCSEYYSQQTSYITTKAGDMVCEGCSDEYSCCAECEEYVPSFDIASAPRKDEEWVCDDCASDMLLITKGNLTYYVANDEGFECASCHDNHENSDIAGETADGESLGTDCTGGYVLLYDGETYIESDQATDCADCNEYYETDDMLHDKEDDEYYCSSCRTKDRKTIDMFSEAI